VVVASLACTENDSEIANTAPTQIGIRARRG